MKKVLFVCTGNTCRSPFAEYCSRELWSDTTEEIEFFSAGIGTIDGLPASKNALKVGAELGVDLSDFSSNSVERELIEEATVILTMTGRQKKELVRVFPEHANKISTLKEKLGLPGDIVDPFGGDEAEYRACYRELRSLLQELYSKGI